jgi:hypothetical protein
MKDFIVILSCMMLVAAFVHMRVNHFLTHKRKSIVRAWVFVLTYLVFCNIGAATSKFCQPQTKLSKLNSQVKIEILLKTPWRE